jgi:hypothetical protein
MGTAALWGSCAPLGGAALPRPAHTPPARPGGRDSAGLRTGKCVLARGLAGPGDLLVAKHEVPGRWIRLE